MRGRGKQARYGQSKEANKKVRRTSLQHKFQFCLNDTPPVFTTPDEVQFANILEAHQMPWQYEPELFVLKAEYKADTKEALTSQKGTERVITGFQPDFYLPSQNMFVELSRTKYADRKWKKIELLQQLAPEIKVMLLRARELDWLENNSTKQDPAEFLQWLEKQVQKNAVQLSKREKRGKRAEI